MYILKTMALKLLCVFLYQVTYDISTMQSILTINILDFKKKSFLFQKDNFLTGNFGNGFIMSSKESM